MIGPLPIVPRGFKVPRRVQTKDFILLPLAWDKFPYDFDAYMSSVEHLQRTFDLDGSSLEIDGKRWPANSTIEFAAVDAAWCQFEWEHLRSSFTYCIFDLQERQQLGCGYIFRSFKVGYHIECQTWVRAERLASGFDRQFYEWFRNWMDEAWPFSSLTIGWPGREISWEEWNKIPSQVWSANDLE